MDIRTLFTRQLNYRYVDELIDSTIFEQLTPDQRPIAARVMFEGMGVRVLRITLAELKGDAEKACIQLLRRTYADVVYLFADSIHDTDATRYHLCNEQGKQLVISADKQRLFMEKIRFFDVADDVTGTLDLKERIAAAFDTARITKTFYREFEKYRDLLLSVIKGIPQKEDQMWYASVLLNRLMFIYFIQKHGLIGGDQEYLRNRLAECEQRGANFYSEFLIPLFFMGFATQPGERGAHEAQLHDVPYLNGGLFLKHPLEEQHPHIAIENSALRTLLDYFNKYNWYLDDRPLRDENEINPDVLGYIFEKYVNQKQMGAYYTKEDITGYICRNTILPFLLSKLQDVVAPHPNPLPQGEREDGHAVLPLAITKDNIERYIYEAVKTEARLPTETDREYAARRKRFAQILQDAAEGRIAHVNDLITWNLDIIRYTGDAVDAIDERALRFFYFECLQKVTVLDPTCGSGAFLFAALNILLPLYQGCIARMRDCVRSMPRTGYANELAAFKAELNRISEHTNERYYIVKTIIVNNLHGVDIMEEGTEICKLRLFLRLAAEIGDGAGEKGGGGAGVKGRRGEGEQGSGMEIEPLPDIDFNIKAGNSLVGFATRDQVQRALETELHGEAVQGKFLTGDTTSESAVAVIERKCVAVDRAYQGFHQLQTQQGIPTSALSDAKRDLSAQLAALNDELNRALAREYGVNAGEGAKGRKGEWEKGRGSEAYASWLEGLRKSV